MTTTVRRQVAALTTIAGTLDGRLPHPWPTRIRTTLHYLTNHLDDALDNLRTDAQDGWSTNASGADIGNGSRGTGHTTPVEAAITGRLAFAGDTDENRAHGRAIGAVASLDHLEHLLREAAALISDAITDPPNARTKAQAANDQLKSANNLIDRWITRISTPKDDKRRMTCNCGQLDGWLEWGNILCDNIAEPGEAGLCIPCNRKRDAWRKRRAYNARRAAHGTMLDSPPLDVVQIPTVAIAGSEQHLVEPAR